MFHPHCSSEPDPDSSFDEATGEETKRAEEAALRRAIATDDAGTELEQQRTHIDDEYARAGEIDPKICITTSHSPSSA